jgi:hypothetical protein
MQRIVDLAQCGQDQLPALVREGLALNPAGDPMRHLAEAAAEILLLDQAGDQISSRAR